MVKKINAKQVKNWVSDNKEISFIDVREIGQHSKGHPFFSISIPYSIFEIRLLELVPNKHVRIVLFDNNNGIAILAAKHAKLMGYNNISILENGIEGWLNAGFELFDGINVPSPPHMLRMAGCRRGPRLRSPLRRASALPSTRPHHPTAPSLVTRTLLVGRLTSSPTSSA